MRYLLIICFLCSSVFAECDFSKIVEKDGQYIYSPALHRCVGALVEKNKLYEEQNRAYDKALELKDLAISKTEERVRLWQDATYKLEDRYNKQTKYNDYRDWIFFGLGVVATGTAVYLAGHIYK